jgi:uncharacterized protein (UPF0332 family)
MTDDVKLGIQKAEEFLEDARYLYEGKRFESSVNRSYYCMFKVVQTLLLEKNILTKTHKGAKTKFNELFLKTNLLPKELGKMFQDAFNIRQDADYEFPLQITEKTAKQTINNAAHFLKTVKAFLEK